MSDSKSKGIIAALATAALVTTTGMAGLSAQSAHAADASDPQNLISIRSYSVIDQYGRTMVSQKNSYQYNNGKAICPVALLRDENNNEIDKSNLVCYYYKNRAKGTASVIIKGINAKGYKDSMLVSYKITSDPTGWKVSTSGLAVSLIADQTWTGGKAITPAFKVKNRNNKILRNGTDYTASFSNNKAVGTATLTIKGKNSYKGQSVSTTFKINKLNLSKCIMTATSAAYANGNPVTTVPTLTYDGQVIQASGNYSLEYANNTEPGEGTVSAVALSDSKNVSGVKKIQYRITMPLSNQNINVASIPDQTWTGAAVQPDDLRVTYGNEILAKNIDYEISGYNDNVNAGRASVVLKGKGAYSGSRAAYFYIKYPFNSRAKVVLQSSELRYTGAPQTPTVIVTDEQQRDVFGNPLKLTEGTHYTVKWEALGGGASLTNGKPTAKGTYQVTATGMGDYYDATNKAATSYLTIVD